MDTEAPKALDKTYVKTWRFDLDGTAHELRLDWTYWSGRRTVYVDGERLAESATWFTWKTTQRLEVAGHSCVVRTEPSWLVSPLFRITLEVDGRVIEPESGSTFWETEVSAESSRTLTGARVSGAVCRVPTESSASEWNDNTR